MSTVNYSRVRLGDLLVEQGTISAEQLQEALAFQKENGGKLGSTLVELNILSEDSLLLALSKQSKMRIINLSDYSVQPEIVRKLPEPVARRFRVIAIDNENGSILVALSDPMNIIAHDEIIRILGTNVVFGLSKESEILFAIDQNYRKKDAIVSLAEQLEFQLRDDEEDESVAEGSQDSAQESPVINILTSVFEDAIQINASDIHIEPDKSFFRIRLRVDGVLEEQIVNEKSVLPALISRIKLMSKLNISEKRLPQDGRFTISVLDKVIDVRVSTLPVNLGESVVMRLIDRSKGIFDIDGLGMPPLIRKTLLNQIKSPYGLILVTGPTGSGKSSTLYACLEHLNTEQCKIITVEDPVEYSISRINQSQIQTQIGLTFSNILRSALRQDPDIVMVGEIRDEDTATIALQAALTGHLVFSTLHTNNSIVSAERLINMGAEPFLVATSLKLVLAQRLVRKLCTNCMEDYKLKTFEKKWIAELTGVDLSGVQFKVSTGCSKCANTGYKGRIAVYEFLEIDEQMSSFLRKEDLSSFSKYASQSSTYRPLSHWALDYAIQGLTSLQEVLRISSGDFDDEI